MAFTFLKALNYNVDGNIIDEESISFCEKLLNEYKDKIILPIDFTTENNYNVKINDLNGEVGYDIGQNSIKLFCEELKDAKRVIINGPMGMFEEERYEKGTKEIYKYLLNNNIKTLIGGGDTAASANKFGYKDDFYHISTGGGATLEYLEGKELPGLSAIK